MQSANGTCVITDTKHTFVIGVVFKQLHPDGLYRGKLGSHPGWKFEPTGTSRCRIIAINAVFTGISDEGGIPFGESDIVNSDADLGCVANHINPQ